MDTLAVPALGPIEWLSPLEADEFAEYRDASFLALLGLARFAPELAAFWPARGPQWDALGRSGSKVILVEAKAQLDEMFSPRTAAGDVSKQKIVAAFNRVRSDLDVVPGCDWTERFYQLANRIAFLWFLRGLGVDAHLLLVSFVNDHDMEGPRSSEAWEAAYRTAFHAMGLPKRHSLSSYIHHAHPDVTLL